MDLTLKKFCDYINFESSQSFSKARVMTAQREGDIFVLTLDSDELINASDLKKFIELASKKFSKGFDININVISQVYDETTLNNYLSTVFDYYFSELSFKPSNEDISEIKIYGNGVVKIEISGLDNYKKFINNELSILRRLAKLGLSNIDLEFTLLKIENEEDDALFKELEERRLQAAKAYLEQQKNPKQQAVPVDPVKTYMNKKMKESEVALSQIKNSFADNIRLVTVKGEIFAMEVIPTRKEDFFIVTFQITDYTEALLIKKFSDGKGKDDIVADFKVGSVIQVTGDLEVDSFSGGQIVLKAKTLKAADSIKVDREDIAPEKRVELGLKTRMTTMGSIVDVKAAVSQAIKWGHDAMAIIDVNSVQAFPEFHSETRKTSVKAIYGVTFTTLDRENNALKNSRNNIELASDEYVVFDFETTGLYPIFNDLIEFGAVKIKDGKIVDKKQFFIKSKRPIPQIITEITSITDKDVANGITEEEAVKEILDYIGDATLVAHNAGFDISFLNEKLNKYGFPSVKNSIIDTMIVARILLPDGRRFNLETFAKKHGVDYDSTIAHRADYDANVLANVWLIAINKLNELKIQTHNDLVEYRDENLYTKAFKEEVTVLSKNDIGLIELFKLVSICSTKQYYREPVLFLDQIRKSKNLLIGSGSLRSRFINVLLGGSKEEVIAEMKNYDYIEIQPMGNFIHLFDEQFGETEYRWMIKFIIDEAKKLGIPVIASGDVRYIEPKDKQIYKMYIYAKQIGGERHYLFRYKTKNPIYPDQHFYSTTELFKEFSFLEPQIAKDIIVTNTRLISSMIEKSSPIRDKLYTPKMEGADENIIKLVYKNAHEKYGANLPQIVKDRIEVEIKPLQEHGYLVIYWIASLLVSKSLREGYLVGSRGSVGSSLVATLSNITEVNPLPPHYVCLKCKNSEFFPNSTLNSGFDLPEKNCVCGEKYHRDGQKIPFETFLGFGANKVPDIDLNFSGDFQATIHDEVKVLFGDTHSLRAGTISTVAAKTAYGFVKAYEEETGDSFSDAFRSYVSFRMEGTKRTTGQHPGGIIVIPKEYDVEYFTAVNYPANDTSSSWLTTHFDFHSIHDNVLKLDLLGHDDPTAIRLLEKLTGITVDKIDMSDEKVISLFSSGQALGITPEDIYGETTGAMGIPEFGTTFVRRMLRAVKISAFGDLIAISGLSHGTDVWSNNAELLVKNEGKSLKEIISCRDDIMNDLINKGMDPYLSFEIMERVRKGKSVTPDQEVELKKHNVENWYIDSLKKIKYMFPKAHATAYVMMAYRIAWFKLYQPLAYYATYFSTRADVFDIKTIVAGPKVIDEVFMDFDERKNLRGPKDGKMPLSNKEKDLIPVLELAKEALCRGIKILNISLIRSEPKNWVIDKEQNAMIPPFNSIDGLGEAVAKNIVEARNHKPFTSIEDFISRAGVNKTLIEKMIDMGIMNDLPKEEQISFDLF